MKVWRSGTSVWWRASSRTSASDGPTSSRPLSAATAIEDLEGVREGDAARGQQHVEVVEDVGGLLAHPLVRLLARRARDLLRLLLDLRAGEPRVGEEGGGVALRAVRSRLSVRDRPLEHRQRLVRRRWLQLAVVEAGALAGVAGRAGRLDQREQRVGVAVVAQLLHRLDVARRRALVPELAARAAPEPGLAALL